ncbi:MBL fold metallo-hydrolase [Catenuloplanes atrovinosus]|uniref:L-ascorbate metabolism protein UlaG (Beta-lactamase superfamily) n=1 Tax=Catenuloplanes atrovinosus TaxID=137266 RepID=A0AAE3YZ27_9ACTN|nr:MBL fold metallo-hydrolase [Catenuloplanes atrovinosus]MDR7280746.1 L-ascorbate metabolism protein UlaG (beta-lactamase superfamily) [Catenuloplanes atrovinosus]
MRITKFTHACVRLERDGAVLVIDPGAFSERDALDGADAILITHEHIDHAEPERIAAVVKERGVPVFAHPGVAAALPELTSVITTVQPGESIEAAGFAVSAHGGAHQIIHPDIPRVPNLAWLVEADGTNVYHPGDSFARPDGVDVDTLFLPISGPWMRMAEAVDFAREVNPRRAFALHDALLSDIGLGVVGRNLERLLDVEYARLQPGTTVS